eukprot:5686121-Amphidinium_carterae.1
MQAYDAILDSERLRTQNARGTSHTKLLRRGLEPYGPCVQPQGWLQIVRSRACFRLKLEVLMATCRALALVWGTRHWSAWPTRSEYTVITYKISFEPTQQQSAFLRRLNLKTQISY